MNGNEEPIGFPLPSASEHDAVSAIGEDSPGNGWDWEIIRLELKLNVFN